MSVSRLFVESDLATGTEAPLSEAQTHYLRHVMRRAAGAELRLFNGRDGEWRATLAVGRKKAAAGRPSPRRSGNWTTRPAPRHGRFWSAPKAALPRSSSPPCGA